MKKIINLFQICLNNNCDILILSALGCGAFKNPPSHISLIFLETIKTIFDGYFKKIIFAIYDDSNSVGSNFKIFENQFSKQNIQNISLRNPLNVIEEYEKPKCKDSNFCKLYYDKTHW
jgi:hypothetical protein